MKKAIGLILILAMCITLFGGCTTEKADTGAKNEAAGSADESKSDKGASDDTENKKVEKTKIRLLAYNNENSRKTYLEHLAQVLPHIQIEFQYVSLDQFSTVLNTQLASKEGPDIIETGGETTLLASAGYLYDLTKEEFIKKYSDTGFQAYTLDGSIYAVPLQSWFEGIYYNKDIFAKYDLVPPSTFNEWMNIHKVLKDNGVKAQTMGAKSWEPMMKQSIGLVLNEFYTTEKANNFDNKFNKGEVKLDSNWNESVNIWKKIIDLGYLTPEMVGVSYEQAQDEFAMGKAAMWESGPWALNTIKEKNPDLNFGMFPIPGLKDNGGWLIGGPGSALAINKDSKNIKAALEVIEATSTPEAQKALVADNMGSSFLLGVNVDLGPEFADCQSAFEKGQVYAPWIYWMGGNPIAESYGKSLQEVLVGKKTVDQALKDADETAKLFINK